jgi:Uma2 family endonuclease
MAAVFKPKPITAEDFEKFDPEWRYDLIRGELHPMPPMPGARHGQITFDLAFEAASFVRKHDLGVCFAAETRFVIEFNPDTAIAPDWAFVAKDRLPEELPEGFLRLAPDIVLEVRSPSDRASEVKTKVARWLSSGVKIVWELNMKTQALTVHRPNADSVPLGPDDILTGDEVLPGFSLPLRGLFSKGR